MNQEPMPDPVAPQADGDSRVPELVRLSRHVLRLLGDRRIPWAYKVIPLLGVLYVLSPVDLVPDTIPVLTQLDDIAVLLVAARLFVRLADRRLAGADAPADEAPTVTTTYRRSDD